MKELLTQDEIDADREAWKLARRGLITATDIPSILGLIDPADDPDDLDKPASFGTPWSVYADKVLGDEEVPDAETAMRYRVGHHYEALAADWYAEHHPEVEFTQAGLCVDDDLPWLACTFDRLAVTADGVVPIECKSSATGKGFRNAPYGDVPPRILAQALIQARIARARQVRIPVVFVPHGPVRTWIINIGPGEMDDIEAMIVAALAFREDHILPGTPPPVDWRAPTTLALKRAYRNMDEGASVRIPVRLARRYRAAKRGHDLAKRRLGQAENEIRERLGHAQIAVTGDGPFPEKVAARSVYTPDRIDLERLRDQFPDVADACTVPGKTVDKLLLKHPRKPRTQA